MSDITEQTIDEQSPSPGGDAPGDDTQQSAADSVLDEHPAAGDDAAEIEGDIDELVRTAAERDEYLALAQRTQADFENYRKRVARESAAAQGRGVASLAKELLPALDNLDRALEAADEEEARRASGQRPAGSRPSSSERGPGGLAEDSLLLDGVRLVRAELSAGLGRVGIESFGAVGDTFDPALHEAVATAPQPPEGADCGTVVEVYQPGYRLGASIIRPARVLVAA